MNKFKVGDVVIGNKLANKYGITEMGWTGVVISVDEPENKIRVMPYQGHDDDISKYDVDSDCFDLYHTQVKESAKMTKQALLDKLSLQDDCYYSVAQVIDMIKNIEEPKNDSSHIELTEEMYNNFLEEVGTRFQGQVIDTAMECLENVVNKYVVVLEKD